MTDINQINDAIRGLDEERAFLLNELDTLKRRATVTLRNGDVDAHLADMALIAVKKGMVRNVEIEINDLNRTRKQANILNSRHEDRIMLDALKTVLKDRFDRETYLSIMGEANEIVNNS